MMGLPGTGKSSIARGLAAAVDGVVISKDEVRAAAFPESVRDYSEEQDDVAMEMVYEAAGYILWRYPGTAVILDGRTFTKEKQVVRLLAWAAEVKTAKRFIECVCNDEVARERLARGQTTAANRDFELYLRLKREADRIEVERLIIDTGAVALTGALEEVQTFLRRSF